MKDIPISERLKTVAQYIPRDAILADIGSDHAYLPCYAYLNGMIRKGIAGEVNAGPLSSAMETIEKYGLALHIEARLGSGLTVLNKGEANTVTIAGMGGELISHILSEGKDRLNRDTLLILQPNVAENRVRAWLLQEGWTICEETILEEDGHIYEIIVAKMLDTTPKLTEDELMFGPFILRQKGEPFYKKWRSELVKRERILQSLTHATSDPTIDMRKRYIENEMNRIRAVLN